MQPTVENMTSLARGKIERARQMSPGQRLLSGPELFDLASSFTRAGIRMRNPGISMERELMLFSQMLDKQRQIEANESERGL